MEEFTEYCGFCNKPADGGMYCLVHGEYVTFCSQECLYLYLQQEPMLEHGYS